MIYPWHLYLMSAIYIGAGIMHFVRPKMYMHILPSYLPGHRFLVIFTGLAEIIIGIALCFSITKNLAIYVVIAMLIFFLPVHFHMLFDKKASMGLPRWMLIGRIPLQFALIYDIDMGGKFSQNLPESDIIYYSDFLKSEDADKYFKCFKDKTPWQQDKIKVFGKEFDQPRLTALYANNEKPYSYSNIVMQPRAFTEEIIEIKSKIQNHCDVEFTTCLLNLYRDGKDSNGWHSDDEKELGRNPVIASVTLGQERFFHLKHKKYKNLKHKILLGHGSLLLMKGATQHNWQHKIAKTAKPVAERINLTFRVIK